MYLLTIAHAILQPALPAADDATIDIGNNPHRINLAKPMEVDDPGALGQSEAPEDVHKHEDNTFGRGPPQQPRATQHRRHGYASVEVHPHAACVLRWEYIDEPARNPEPDDSDDPLGEKKFFEVCEWLMHAPISDEVRAAYFNLKLVSFVLRISYLQG
jgi:hypothetical protein